MQKLEIYWSIILIWGVEKPSVLNQSAITKRRRSGKPYADCVFKLAHVSANIRACIPPNSSTVRCNTQPQYTTMKEPTRGNPITLPGKLDRAVHN
jgi:hypothetical protein